MNEILNQYARRLVAQERRINPALFNRLTPAEEEVLEAVRTGCFEIPHVVEETGLPARQVERILAELVDRGMLRKDKRGGKTAAARGARVDIYVPR